MNGIIRIADPTKIGPALADLRNMLGIGRRQFARLIAPKANRTEDSVTSQLFKWDRGTVHPGGAALRLVLDELGYDLALVPREDA